MRPLREQEVHRGGGAETIEMMQKQSSSETSPTSVLAPTTPVDVAERAQRRRIVDAMIASCAEKTYTATTISDIVGRARISRTTFYKRFGDKRECFDAAVELSVEELRDAVRESRAGADSPLEAIHLGAAALLEALSERPEVAQLLTAEVIAVEPGIVERLRQLLLPALETVWDGDGAAVPDGRYLDPRLAFGRSQVLVFSTLTAGQSKRLTELLPEIVYLAVAPFAGHDQALRQAQMAAAAAPSDRSDHGDG
jgi:AcrR family transcriptional regulator